MGFPCGHLCHPSDTTTPQSGVLVAVAPAVDRSLDEAALSPQARVELRQRPADCVALSLVVQAIALVLVLSAARAGVDTVLSLEVLWQLVNVDRLDIAADCVLHLDAVARILESDPLHSILVLPYDQWCGSGDGTRSSVGVDIGAARRTSVHVGRANWRPLRRGLRWAAQSRWWPLELWCL